MWLICLALLIVSKMPMGSMDAINTLGHTVVPKFMGETNPASEMLPENLPNLSCGACLIISSDQE